MSYKQELEKIKTQVKKFDERNTISQTEIQSLQNKVKDMDKRLKALEVPKSGEKTVTRKKKLTLSKP